MSWSNGLAWDGTNSRLAVNTATANTKLDVNGDIALRQNSITLANGNNNNVSVGNYSFIRITGPNANFTITGISGGQDGRMLIIYNKSGQAMTIRMSPTLRRIRRPGGGSCRRSRSGSRSLK